MSGDQADHEEYDYQCRTENGTTMPFNDPPMYTYESTPVSLPIEHPHKCPVCDGRGFVPMEFYGAKDVIERLCTTDCHTCKGEGILWRM